ncbi:MAG: CxxC-x17-CxxC domain-containing protein [Candidatus Nanoarchaeia archaeon]
MAYGNFKPRSGTQRSGSRFGGSGGGSSFNRGPRQMFKAVCSDCGKECEVPFKPSNDKPVYCRDCYQKRKFGDEAKPRFQKEESVESESEESDE